MIKKFALATACSLAFTSSAFAGDITIEEVWAAVEHAGHEGEGAHADIYLRLTNSAAAADRLYAVKSKAAKEIHMEANSEAEKHDEGHKEAVSLLIPSGESVLHSDTGAHIELLGLTDELEVGDSFTVTLFFENAGRVKAKVEVKKEVHEEDEGHQQGKHDEHDEHDEQHGEDG